MNTFSQIFELELEQKISKADLPEATKIGEPMGVKTTPTIDRRDLIDLEQAYISEGLLFKGINNIVEVIMSGGPVLTGDNKSVLATEDFFETIGNEGGFVDIESIFENLFKHQCVYGRAFNELIYDEGAVVDLDYIDPKKMDYAKNQNQKISLDKFNNPVGYTETIPYSAESGKIKTDTSPKGVVLQSNQIFFDPRRIANYKLFTIGDGFYGIGLIEPIYKTYLRRTRASEAMANVYLQSGSPMKYMKVGDQMHEPTNEMLDRAEADLVKTNFRSSIVTPYWADLKIIESKNVDKLGRFLDYLTDEEITVLGPKALITGLGEETNRATLQNQEYMFKLSLKDIIRRTLFSFQKQVINRFSTTNGLNSSAKISWKEINIEELDSKARRIIDYANSGIIEINDSLKDFVRKSEGLPAGDSNGRI